MMIIDYLLSYILLLIALHFMYLFYILSFTFNTITMIHSIDGIDTFDNNTIIYNGNIVIIDSISSIPFNTTF